LVGHSCSADRSHKDVFYCQLAVGNKDEERQTNMKKRIITIFSLLIILAMVLTVTALGKAPSPASSRTSGQPPRPLQEVPADVQAYFKDGVPVSQFLADYKGPVPQALAKFSTARMAVIVEMEGEPLAAAFSAAQQARRPFSTTAQQQYAAELKQAQAPVVTSLKDMDGIVISQYTKAYNGLLANVPVSELASIRSLPGVKAVHRAPVMVPSLTASVPLIRADLVQNDLGYDGDGVTIAVIDTGIDYTHAALGGSGDPDDYTNNDPDIIEGGTFPTAKVVGGYDFAGTNYDADSDVLANTIPVPDPDPLDENGHGTHVSSTAAGVGVTGVIGVGVAPGASLYALKVFGAEGSTNLVVDAIEWAMDPNNDNDLSDHVDVINMSLGSDYGPDDPSDPDIAASNNASAAGVVVVASSGNAGDTPYITGSPADAGTAISVAAGTTGYVTGPTISAPASSPEITSVYQPPEFDGGTGHFTSDITAPLSYAGTITATDTLCDITGIPANAMDGDIALIQRGDCAFTDKVNNAGTLGAVGAIIFNSESGGESRSTMVGDPVSIPAGFIPHSDGVDLQAYEGDDVVVSAEDTTTSIEDAYTPADTMADFSSRGPSAFASMLKPDITAPGVAIFAAKMGGGTTGVSLNGTSMAAPHVAGTAALVKEAHPSWTPEQIKAAMMNTAVDMADADSAQTPRQGAGRVDAYSATISSAFLVGDAGRVSLNYGVISTSADVYTETKDLTLQNDDTISKTYDVSWDFGPDSYFAGFDLTLPLTVTVEASPDAATIPVDLALDTTQMPNDFEALEEYYGYITLTNTDNVTDTLRVPFYAVVEPYTELDLTGSLSGVNAGEVAISQTGPITSSLWVYPLLATSSDDPTVGNEADIRMFGMDYGWNDPDYGEIFVPAIDVYGSWPTPQPYFAEFDLYLDVNGDSTTDFIDFNFNYGWFTGGDDNDTWIVVQVDLSDNMLYLGSPYTTYTDYNTGYTEWYLPADWNGLGGGDSEFDYALYGFDHAGQADAGAAGSFDYAKMPFLWELSNFGTSPSDPDATLTFSVYDPAGYSLAAPLGMMVVDYTGQAGVGQAYAYEFSFDQPYSILLPVIKK
jgi:minor extracellular serine protease Vpr